MSLRRLGMAPFSSMSARRPSSITTRTFFFPAFVPPFLGVRLHPEIAASRHNPAAMPAPAATLNLVMLFLPIIAQYSFLLGRIFVLRYFTIIVVK